MTQLLPLSIILGASNTGKLIGYQVLNLGRSEYAAFTLATESVVLGTYYAPDGYEAPDGGGYLIVCESDGGNPAALTPIADVPIEPERGNVGPYLYSDTVTIRASGLPVDGALVQVATDSAFANIIRSGYTNGLGQVTFQYDSVGTYYGRAELAGYNIVTFAITVSA